MGPNLDEAKPEAALVVDRVTNGSGAMPSFADELSEEQIVDVAAYVSLGRGRFVGASPGCVARSGRNEAEARPQVSSMGNGPPSGPFPMEDGEGGI